MLAYRNTLISLAFVGFSAACGDDAEAPSVDGGAGSDAGLGPADGGASDSASGSGGDGGGDGCEHEVACQEASFENLGLLETPAGAGVITEEGTTEGEFLTRVDATGAPTAGTTPTTSYVYARFTETGLEQVAIDDDAAFASTEWDIALRRYIIRLNSGVSGPSCVRGARLPPSEGGEPPAFESVTEVPEGLELFEETYFTDAGGACTFVSDGSGLPGAPDSVIASYWTYSGCLSMTGNVFVVALRDGREVKLQVLSYYSPENQASCDESGMITVPSGAANFRIRWAFLDDQRED